MFWLFFTDYIVWFYISMFCCDHVLTFTQKPLDWRIHAAPWINKISFQWLTMMTCRLQQDLSCVLGLEVGVSSSWVGHHPCGASSGAKGQVGGRVGIWRVGGQVGGRGEEGHTGQRGLRLVLGLAGGVGGLELVGEGVVLLVWGQVVKLLPKVK